MKLMPTNAKLYISLVCAVGLALLVAALVEWQSADTVRYATYVCIALLAATRKVQLPKLTGTISPSFVFVLLALAQCSFAEVIIMTVATAFVQCCWMPKRPPQAVQVLFSACTLAASAALAFGSTHGLLAPIFARSLSLELCVATTIYFVGNTVMVSVVLCLVQRKPLTGIWEQCVSWSFPYYLIGAALVGIMTETARIQGYAASLLALPLLYLVSLTYRLCVARLGGVPVVETAKAATA